MILNLLVLFKLFFIPAPHQAEVPASIYDFKVQAVNGSTIDFSQYRGKKILIVNTTSVNGNDPQYAELEALYQKYKDKLVIVGFLDDDFGTAPGSKKETEPFRVKNYNVTFPLAAKVLIKGDNRAPVYKWLTDKKYNKLADSEIKWDFQKYLINEQGQLVEEFDPKIRVTDPKITAAIEK